MISAALDYLPVSFSEYLYHLYLSFSYNSLPIHTEKSNINRVLGYSCRSLFDTILRYYYEKNKNLKILTTPIHHTSFRNIIEKYVKPENLYILDINTNYNSISGIPEYNVDVCIITHMFGQDLNCKYIIDNMDKFPTNTIFIEDRVQGGTFLKPFSNNFINISLYSCGMDKKPCGLGGGLALIKNSHSYSNKINSLVTYLKIKIFNYSQENFYNRLWFLIKKFPTFLLYNCKWFINFILWIFTILKIDLHRFSSNYRKNNPGFDHDNYNKSPSNGTLQSINYAVRQENYLKIENLYSVKSKIFFGKLNDNTIRKMFKWNNDRSMLLTPYNTISVKDPDSLVSYLNSQNIPVIKNPTYKIFNYDHKDKEYYKEFNDSLVYLPSLAIMNEEEMEYLAILINNYFGKNS